MKKIVFTFLFFILNVSLANVTFYKTYQDYVQKKGQDMGELKEIQQSSSYGVSFVVTKDGKKEKYSNSKLNGYWAVDVDGVLFKVLGKYNGDLFEIVYLGKKVYCYEQASNRLEAINNGDKTYKPASSKTAILYFGTDPEAMPEMLAFSLKGKIKESLREKFPTLKEPFDKIDAGVAANRRRTAAEHLNDFINFDQGK